MMATRFPRTLYRQDADGAFKFRGGIRYNSLVVYNAEELDAAEEMGYIDSFHDCIFGIPPVEPVKPDLRGKRKPRKYEEG